MDDYKVTMSASEDKRRAGRSINIASAEVLSPVFASKIDYATLQSFADNQQAKLSALRTELAKRVHAK